MVNNRNTKIVITLVVVVAFILIYMLMNKKPANLGLNQNNGQSVESTEDTSFGSINDGASAPTLSYASALSKYQGVYLALDESCKASQNKITLRGGGPLMVDNTSDMDRVIKVGSTFNVRAHSFKIVQVDAGVAGATVPVDCDQSENVATVLVQ